MDESRAGSAVMRLELVTNETVRGYQVQVKGDANYNLEYLQGRVRAQYLKGKTVMSLYMGAVVDIRHFKDMAIKIHDLQKVGFKPVGQGSTYHPEMVLNQQELDLEAHR